VCTTTRACTTTTATTPGQPPHKPWHPGRHRHSIHHLPAHPLNLYTQASIISIAKRSALYASSTGGTSTGGDAHTVLVQLSPGGTATCDDDEVPWHAVDSAEEVVEELASSAKRGLTKADAARRCVLGAVVHVGCCATGGRASLVQVVARAHRAGPGCGRAAAAAAAVLTAHRTGPMRLSCRSHPAIIQTTATSST
jgi:hypothetical protein